MPRPGRIGRRRRRIAVAAAAACGALALAAAPQAAAEDLSDLEIWAALMNVYGHDTESPGRLPEKLDAGEREIIIVTDPGAIDESAAVRLRSYVEDGGRLIVLDGASERALRTLAGQGLEESGTGSTTAAPLVPVDETLGVAAVAVTGDSVFESSGAALPVLGGEGGPILLTRELGDGELLISSDSSFVTDDFIQESDNALMALRLVGSGDAEVTLAPDLRAEKSSGLGALPDGWLWATGGLLLAALALIWARARRIGPVQRSKRELPPPRREYLEAMSAVLARTGTPGEAAKPIRREALRRLGRRTGLPPSAGRDEILRAAEQAGLDEDQAAALAGGGTDEKTAIAAGAALAALTERSVDATR